MKRRKSSGAYRKEKIILTASSVLVLTAMTVTGVYIYNSNQPAEQENNVVDFSALENSAQEKDEQVAQAQNSSAQNLTSGQDGSGELDYDPYYVEQERLLNDAEGSVGGQEALQTTDDEQEALGTLEAAGEGGNNVGYAEVGREGEADTENAETAGDETETAGEGTDAEDETAGEGQEGLKADGDTDGEAAGDGMAADAEGVENQGLMEENADMAADAGGSEAQEAVADVMQEEVSLNFSEDEKLQWPIVGNVILNYSMDKTVYFQTLQQYKYNPSIVIGATQGTSVACAADGVVKSIYQDPQTGNTVVMSLGDGYELSYGQLQDLTVEEGDFVEAGAFIGKVAAPTKYYTAEGTNVYFKLTKDGEPVNPLNYLG